MYASRKTNLGNLTADANLAIAREITGDDSIVVSIKNGGGIRDDIGRVTVPAGGTGEPEELPNEEIPPRCETCGRYFPKPILPTPCASTTA